MTSLAEFKPMLAQSIDMSDLDNLIYPVAIQPKLDGIRCVLLNGSAFTRSMKSLPNRYIRNELERYARNNEKYLMIDGEIQVGLNFQETTSAVMTRSGMYSYTYLIFDKVLKSFEEDFAFRFHPDETVFTTSPIRQLYTMVCKTKEEVMRQHELLVDQMHYEGLIIRSLRGGYKFGRSTFNEQLLLKLKLFADAEATVVGFEELYSNNNEQFYNELGLADRSDHAENKIPMDTLGALIVKCPLFPSGTFKIGTGFTELQRKLIWKYKGEHIGKTVKFKYQNYGIKDLPRSPVFLGWRKD